jgi:tricorn protease
MTKDFPMSANIDFEAYLSEPGVHKDIVVFIADDDLWRVPLAGGTAARLTANRGVVHQPKISPDGRWIAYLGQDAGALDVYLISINGGEPRRLTYFGVQKIVRWKDTRNLIVASSFETIKVRELLLYNIDIETSAYEPLPWGPATDIDFSEGGCILLGRHCGDPARWKRYRGGTAGVLWVRKDSRSRFERILKNIKTNISTPHLRTDKIYFITDHEGHGNVYVCDLNGKNVKRLTHHNEFYCRNLNTDGTNLVYNAGGDIYFYNLETEAQGKIPISCPSPSPQATPRFVSAAAYLEDYSFSPDLQSLTVISRGHAFSMAPFKGAVTNLDRVADIRFSYPHFSFDSKTLIYSGISSTHDEHLIVYDRDRGQAEPILIKKDWGKIHGLLPNPKKDLIALMNNRLEFWLVDYKNKKTQLVEKSDDTLGGMAWSPCGRYLAYSVNLDKRKWAVKIFDIQTKKARVLMDPVLSDLQMSFDPSGKYLYITSVREFGAVYNETHFDLGFPAALRPYVVILAKDTPSPLEAPLDGPKIEPKKDDKKKTPKVDKKTDTILTKIDFDGIEHRVLPLPLEFGGYGKIAAIDGGLIYTRKKIEPLLKVDLWTPSHKGDDLYVYRFDKGREDLFHHEVLGFEVNAAGTQILMRSHDRLRFVPTNDLPSHGNTVGKADGWVDLDRVRLHVEPKEEWKQMYREAWLLQKEHFWRADMSKIDWNYVYRKYLRLLERIKTRSELSDLLWEMQGELGTSHAYEFGGDYHRRPPYNPTGFLGARFRFLPTKKAFEVVQIFRGDSYIAGTDSPLLKPSVSMNEGDLISAVDAHGFSGPNDLWKALEHKAGVVIELTIQRKGQKNKDKVCVETLRSQSAVRYREWVNQNKAYVHKASQGRLGYVHIPDMGPMGYAEFYRNFISEQVRDGLVIDVRFNGGGHVSQHILKVLAQRPLGADVSRYHGQFYYPTYAIRGPLVALTNELAGSDGDIFSHSFKLMKLGPLVGKRTWGGVIGISPKTYLRDHSLTTQPEFSYYFKDVGWQVENYGTEPDFEVDITPEDYAANRDPQLDKAIELALKAMKKNPPFEIKFSDYPDLRAPLTIKPDQ